MRKRGGSLVVLLLAERAASEGEAQGRENLSLLPERAA